MADLTTTQLKLRTTPTAGVASEQSPYYRRLLSAGYKGFLQGTVGGSTLYALIGGAIGGLVALPLIPFTGGASLALIPAMAGLGLYKGASTFGQIGSLAAITAESAEMSEKRRYLLDRYYELPDTPEFDDEAQQIRELLAKQHESKAPSHMFHWRTVAVGALIGGAVALGLLLIPGAMAFLGEHLFLGEVAHAIGAASITPIVAVAGAALGALSGGMIGLDRFYVRSWLDKSASVMHDTKTIEEQIVEREREIQKLGERGGRIVNAEKAEKSEEAAAGMPGPRSHLKIQVAEPSTSQPAPAEKKTTPARDVDESHPHDRVNRRESPINPRQIAGLEDAPSTTAASAQHQGRIALEQALERPVL